MSNIPASGGQGGDFAIEDLVEGQTYSFLASITPQEMMHFCQLSGDTNPLHMDDDFARKRGFRSRVVYGLLMGAYVSRMAGMFLPGKNCLLLGVDLKFVSPCYVGDTIEVTAVVREISMALKAAVLKVVITNKASGHVLARGKVTVGFTGEPGAAAHA